MISVGCFCSKQVHRRLNAWRRLPIDQRQETARLINGSDEVAARLLEDAPVDATKFNSAVFLRQLHSASATNYRD
jgi:hypothetical protein